MSPIASIARIESSMVTHTVGGSVIVRADDTSMQSLSDLKERKVVACCLIAALLTSIGTCLTSIIGHFR